MSRSVLFHIPVVALVASAGAAFAQSAAPPPAVLVETAELRALARQAEFIGRVQAMEKVELRARVQGFLGPRGFDEGTPVAVGQVLFVVERAPFEAAVAGARAQLAAAEATRDNAAMQLERTRELVQRNTVAQAQLDQRIAEDARARADVLQAQAALKDAEIKLSYTEIKAPIAGRIGRATVSTGNLVGPDTGVLATIVSQDKVQVLFPVTQRELLEARRNVGNRAITVRARLADGSLARETGSVDFVDPQVDPRTDTQLVRAVFANPDRVLADGQTVRLSIEQTAPQKVLTIPQQALASDQTGAYVFVVGDGNVVQQRRIKLGTQRDGLVAVTEGLTAGERVIVQGQQRARPGQAVTPQQATAPRS